MPHAAPRCAPRRVRCSVRCCERSHQSSETTWPSLRPRGCQSGTEAALAAAAVAPCDSCTARHCRVSVRCAMWRMPHLQAGACVCVCGRVMCVDCMGRGLKGVWQQAWCVQQNVRQQTDSPPGCLLPLTQSDPGSLTHVVPSSLHASSLFLAPNPGSLTHVVPSSFSCLNPTQAHSAMRLPSCAGCLRWCRQWPCCCRTQSRLTMMMRCKRMGTMNLASPWVGVADQLGVSLDALPRSTQTQTHFHT